MPSVQIVLFEDDRIPRLAPVALARPGFEIGCGGYTLRELLAPLGELRYAVRPHLQGVVEADWPGMLVGNEEIRGPLLWVNARVVPSVRNAEVLRKLIAAGGECVVEQGESIAAMMDNKGVRLAALAQRVSETRGHGASDNACELSLFDWPHDVLRHHLANFAANLQHRLASGPYREMRNGLFAAADVSLHPSVVTDTKAGPIVIDAGTSVGPFTLLRGPVFIGRNCRISEHAAIKDGTALGHTVKLGGEVEASIIEPYSNKQHHGFLGHGYVGSWVNLGAGTSNSDLKNTYGNVNMEYAGEKIPTGMQFVGCFVGDYAKTAVNTSIFTGKTLGACSMSYGFVTTGVPSFCNYARSFGQLGEIPAEVQIATQARMFARRNVPQRSCDVQLLRDLFELTRGEREGMTGGPLAL